MASKTLRCKIPISNSSGLSTTLYLPSTLPNPQTPLPLIVFVNGLLTEASDWEDVSRELTQKDSSRTIIAFDRWNRGNSDPLPESYVENDISTAAADLSVLLQKIYGFLGEELKYSTTPKLVLVGSSIGCCIIRLFVSNHCSAKHIPAGIIFLDSYISNTDFTSLFPPTSPSESPALTKTREIISSIFHPSVPNPEGLSRENARELLPEAGEPKFPEVVEELLVVSHDSETNVEDMVAKLGIDRECYLRYVESAWEAYNKGLEGLREGSRSMVAKGSGHFVMKNRPDLVVEVVGEIVKRVSGG